MEKRLAFDEALTVKDIVVSDYRTADVFKKFGINYCCSGNVTLKEACERSQTRFPELHNELLSATSTVVLPIGIQFNDWSLDFVVDYILNVHHAHVKATLPGLQTQLTSFANSHKKKYPGLIAIQNIFNELAALLLEHIEQEEDKIFPYIKQISSTHKRRETYGSLFVRTLSKPLENELKNGHTHIEAMVKELRLATNDYKFPEGACTNYQVIFHKLKQFDYDLTQHKHLENNILFPKALSLEKELLQL